MTGTAGPNQEQSTQEAAPEIPDQNPPEEPAKTIPVSVQSGGLSLPETAFWGEDGNLYHRIERVDANSGRRRIETRHLAITLEQAREKHWDFFHPRLGWIWDGYKRASDYTPAQLMADTSVGGAIPKGEVGLPQ